MRVEKTWGLALAFAISMVTVGSQAYGQELRETSASSVVADDSHMALAPPERGRAANPSDAHVQLMEELTAARLRDTRERANRLESARRTAPVDLLWGVR